MFTLISFLSRLYRTWWYAFGKHWNDTGSAAELSADVSHRPGQIHPLECHHCIWKYESKENIWTQEMERAGGFSLQTFQRPFQRMLLIQNTECECAWNSSSNAGMSVFWVASKQTFGMPSSDAWGTGKVAGSDKNKCASDVSYRTPCRGCIFLCIYYQMITQVLNFQEPIWKSWTPFVF